MPGDQRLAYLGPPGTNSEVAAIRYDPDADRVPYPTVLAVVRAVQSGLIARGIAPIENSLHGTVTDTVDALIELDDIAICGEVVLPIAHCLMVRPGTSRETIDVIYSHPQSLGQCRRYLETHFAGIRTEASLSNSAAVEVAMRTAGAAAIGPQRAADLYGAEVLERNIEDSKANKTRFVVLGAESAPRSGDDKTSLAFAVAHDRPGTLVSVLHEFADRAINMTKIESRPSGEGLGVYIFLIDIQGHRSDPMIAQALAAVKEQSEFFKIFGSYPAWRDDEAPA